MDASFGDKIIYLKCYQPTKPFHDGSEAGRSTFLKRLTDSLPAFLEAIDANEIPDRHRGSRFYVREFHHHDVLEAINGAAAESPLGELIDLWMEQRGELDPVEETAAALYEMLRAVNGNNISGYTKSVRHFGHQLSRLSRHPVWRGRIQKIPRRVGGRIKNDLVNFWRISPLRANAD